MTPSLFGNLIWLFIIANHARLLKNDVPEGFCKHAIPISLLISSTYGLVVKAERRAEWKLKLPLQLLVFVSVNTAFAYFKEIVFEFHQSRFGGFEDIFEYIYVHCGFWMWLYFKSTDISQVLVPMFLFVRPYKCLFLGFILACQNAF